MQASPHICFRDPPDFWSDSALQARLLAASRSHITPSKLPSGSGPSASIMVLVQAVRSITAVAETARIVKVPIAVRHVNTT